MLHNGLAHLMAKTVDEVEHTRRETDSMHDLGEMVGGEGGKFRRFRNNGVPHQERWSHFPRQQVQWKVPRCDQANNTNGFSVNVVGCSVADECSVFMPKAVLGKETKIGNGPGGVNASCQ